MSKPDQQTKIFKLLLNHKMVIDLVIEGDAELVKAFINEALTGPFAAFAKTQDAFRELFINGIQHELQVIQRDPAGHFVSRKKVAP